MELEMPRSINVRRSLALTGAFVLATWGAAALPASALDPGAGSADAHGQAQHQKKSDDKKSDDKKSGDKSGGKSGDTSDQSNDTSGDQSQGNKGGNGKGNGPKSPNPGNGPKSPNPGNGGNGGGNGGSGGKGGQGGGQGDPAGNNGTVKITPHGEMDGIPQNTPHVTCVFDIEWYGFDEGDDIVSTVTFAMQAPTSDVVLSGTEPAQVFVGGDPATGAGTETGFDGEQVYTLGFDGEPHPQQGYHVKLTINTPGSIGADVKHKVFWVEPCTDEVAGTTDETDETDETTDTEGTTDTTDTTEEGEDSTLVLGEQASADTASSDQAEETQVMGAQASAPASVLAAEAANGEDVPSAVDAGEEGNPVVDFVTSPLPLLVIALGALLAGAALVSRRRSNA